MTRIRTLSTIVVVIAGAGASSASARPVDVVEYDAGYASTAVAKAHAYPKQDLRSPDARAAALPRAAGPPTWPINPAPLHRPEPVAVSDGGNGLPTWPIVGAAAALIGLGTAGASRMTSRRRQEARLGT